MKPSFHTMEKQSGFMHFKYRNAVFHGTVGFFEILQTKFNVYQTEMFKIKETLSICFAREILCRKFNLPWSKRRFSVDLKFCQQNAANCWNFALPKNSFLIGSSRNGLTKNKTKKNSICEGWFKIVNIDIFIYNFLKC